MNALYITSLLTWKSDSMLDLYTNKFSVRDMEKAKSLLELSRLDGQAFLTSSTAIEISEDEAAGKDESTKYQE